VCDEEADKRCQRCKQVLYCSRACQRNHWKQHKKPCKATAKLYGSSKESAAAVYNAFSATNGGADEDDSGDDEDDEDGAVPRNVDDLLIEQILVNRLKEAGISNDIKNNKSTQDDGNPASKQAASKNNAQLSKKTDGNGNGNDDKKVFSEDDDKISLSEGERRKVLKAHRKQVKDQKESGVDYIVRTPANCNADHGVQAATAMGRIMLTTFKELAAAGSKRGVWMVYDFLRNQDYSYYERNGAITDDMIRSQLKREYGCDPYEGKNTKNVAQVTENQLNNAIEQL